MNTKEDVPDWLDRHQPGDKPPPGQFLNSSRVVFYPGSGVDGSPVRFFGSRHLAHCFVYCDYALSQLQLEEALEAPGTGFRGYRLLDRVQLIETDLVAGPIRYHLSEDEIRNLGGNSTQRMPLHQTPFGFLEILERAPEYGDDHGPTRLGIVFLYADGHAAYDALFCQVGGAAPYALVLQDHGWGGNHSPFGAEGLVCRIAERTDRRPQYLWCANGGTVPWPGYSPVPGVPVELGGVHGTLRTLLERSSSEK